MESRGRSFLQELRDAIEAAERVIAVIGPHAIQSPYVRAELVFADANRSGLQVGGQQPRERPAVEE